MDIRINGQYVGAVYEPRTAGAGYLWALTFDGTYLTGRAYSARQAMAAGKAAYVRATGIDTDYRHVRRGRRGADRRVNRSFTHDTRAASVARRVDNGYGFFAVATPRI